MSTRHVQARALLPKASPTTGASRRRGAVRKASQDRIRRAVDSTGQSQIQPGNQILLEFLPRSGALTIGVFELPRRAA